MKSQKNLKKREIQDAQVQNLISVFAKMQEVHNSASSLALKALQGLKDLSHVVKQLQSVIVRLPDSKDYRKALLKAADLGWYFPIHTWDAEEIFKVESLIDNQKFQSVNQILIPFYKDRLKDLENELLKRFPKRGKVLSAAFQAHNGKAYELSIPIFISQAEGIFYDQTGEFYFRKKNKKQTWINALNDPYLIDILSNLVDETALTIHSSKMSNYPSGINRHLILHGLDSKYPSRLNSFKAISFLYAISINLSDILTWKN